MLRIPWRPLPIPGSVAATGFVARVIQPWIGTEYMEGQGLAGVKTDCVRSLAGIGCALERREPIELDHLPADVALHCKETALGAMRDIMKFFPLWERIINPDFLEPGDMLAVGPLDGGPGHAMFVDARPNGLVHATPDGFHRTGIGAIGPQQKIFCIYRYTKREDWSSWA